MSPLRPLVLALLATVSGGATQAQPVVPDPVIAAQLASSWEVLWHQSGIPTRVARWGQPIRLQVVAAPSTREYIVRALTEVTDIANVPMSQENKMPNMVVEVVPETALEDREPCVTQMDVNVDTNEIDQIHIKMRANNIAGCMYHEAMHSMGLRGHPSGPTILSYFHQGEELTPLDKVMLRAWYSPAMRTGASPLEAIPVLADEVVCDAQDRDLALLMRNAFLEGMVGESKRFVDGEIDAPSILRKSGKATEVSIKKGRTLMALYLDSSRHSNKPFSQLQCQSTVTYSATAKPAK